MRDAPLRACFPACPQCIRVIILSESLSFVSVYPRRLNDGSAPARIMTRIRARSLCRGLRAFVHAPFPSGRALLTGSDYDSDNDSDARPDHGPRPDDDSERAGPVPDMKPLLPLSLSRY